MNKVEIIKIVKKTLKDYFESIDESVELDEEIILFGSNSILDSIGLVNVIVDIESRFNDEEYNISLASEKAMSKRQSPFRTIETLVDFIYEQIEESNE